MSAGERRQQERPLRLAVIGVGDVARHHYLPEAHRLAGKAEITVVCGRHPERAREVADEYGVPRWTCDVREAIDGDADVVVNLTPHDVHRDITQAALQSDCHVFSEKPLAATSADARELGDEAARRGLVLACAPAVMLFRQVSYVGKLLASGDLGEIRSVRAQAIGGMPPWAGFESDPSPYFGPSGGPLVDIGVYPLHALIGLLGPATSVMAMSQRTRDSFVIADGEHRGTVVPVDCQDHWQLLVRTPGCIASVEASFATAKSTSLECEFRGDAGSVAFSVLDHTAPVRVLRSGSTEWDDVRLVHERASGPDLMLGVLHLIDCVLEGRPPLIPADHAIHVLDILAAAGESVTRGESVAVASLDQQS